MLFREINERIHELNSGRASSGEFLCECIRRDCVAPVSLSLDEYEAVRRIPTHFAVLPGHHAPHIERIVETERYTTVEKFGDGGSVAVRLDPRRRQSATEGAESGAPTGARREVIHAQPA